MKNSTAVVYIFESQRSGRLKGGKYFKDYEK